jgi:hypothetical protein
MSEEPQPLAQQPRSHLFTLRLWQEDLGAGRREWRGKVHHVTSDDVTYFRDWAALLPVVLAMLRRSGATISFDQTPDWAQAEEDDTRS